MTPSSQDQNAVWIGHLDDLKARLNLNSDAKLARHLGFSPRYLSDVRKHGKPASAMLKFRVLDAFGLGWDMHTVLELLPDDVRDCVIAKLRDRHRGSNALSSIDPP